MDIDGLSQIVHLIQMVYASTITVNQAGWLAMAPEDQMLTINGVNHVLNEPDITPEQLHAIWVAAKAENGWRCGNQKCDTQKTHPCMCQYPSLPIEEQIKPRLFVAIVNAMAPLVDGNNTQRIPSRIVNNFNIYQNG